MMKQFALSSVKWSLCAAALLLFSCGQSEANLKSSVEGFEQKLEIDLAGKPIVIPLEGMEIYLTEDDEYNERYEILGTGVVLTGEFPSNVRVDYGEHWDRMVGQEIPISPKSGERYREEESRITLPGYGEYKVTGGSFKVEKHRPGYDAKTPLTGTIEIKIMTNEGENTLKGKFAVMGTTWG